MKADKRQEPCALGEAGRHMDWTARSVDTHIRVRVQVFGSTMLLIFRLGPHYVSQFLI